MQALSTWSWRVDRLNVEFYIAVEPRGSASERVGAIGLFQVRDREESKSVQVRAKGREAKEEGGEGTREAREEFVEGKGEEGEPVKRERPIEQREGPLANETPGR